MVDRKKLINRVNRAEGQLRGIVKMMEEERECRDVVIQLAAVKASVEKIIHIIVTENLMECMIKDGEEVGKEQLEDALDLILKIK
ncbi:MAG TPA: cytoplasmic protein [Proteiniclasticum sp.]|uniref:DNA-binding transcriptional regulator, FrmR family n=1 Tax=Proteiniclasticum ruminis TaxID=398199 RepID=A0A1I5B6K4_9CLOT|nr:DNA-binding transcriptional regulator, FrmR family [Proteiniclasticum ruminis]HBW12355.1 cytoplasmic protein [Proteiniclasticum sp.]